MGDVNRFGPLTPEQQEMLRRQALSTETVSPFDVLLPGGVGAVLGRAAGRGVVSAAGAMNGMAFPTLTGLAALGGYDPRRPVNWGGRIGAGLGGLMGIGIGFGSPESRARMNTMRDAEGQMDGYYGDMIPTSRDAEAQQGGFYGGPVNRLLELLDMADRLDKRR